jgi:hypothetical protein
MRASCGRRNRPSGGVEPRRMASVLLEVLLTRAITALRPRGLRAFGSRCATRRRGTLSDGRPGPYFDAAIHAAREVARIALRSTAAGSVSPVDPLIRHGQDEVRSDGSGPRSVPFLSRRLLRLANQDVQDGNDITGSQSQFGCDYPTARANHANASTSPANVTSVGR